MAFGLGAAAPGIVAAEPPQIRFESPANGATVSGVVETSVRVSERDEAVASTDLFVDGGRFDDPGTITVRSNLGGSDTAVVEE